MDILDIIMSPAKNYVKIFSVTGNQYFTYLEHFIYSPSPMCKAISLFPILKAVYCFSSQLPWSDCGTTSPCWCCCTLERGTLGRAWLKFV